MSDQAYANVQSQQKTLSGASPKSSLLQRTCACGQHTIASDECSTCRSKQSKLLRSQRASGLSSTPGSFPAQENVLPFNAAADRASRFGHDFSKIPVYSSQSPVLQTKLAIDQPGDQYEQEADRISEQVMRMPEPQRQRACACGGACPRCQKEQPGQEHERLQTKRVQASDMGQISVPPIVHEVLRSPGQPLDTATRAFMEPRFGHDFSQVHVHADIKAAESADVVKARAYTVGQHVVFGEGQPSPETTAGRQLLAHELAHVVQQRRGGLPPTLEASGSLEQAADQAAAEILQGDGTIRVVGASAPGIARETPRPKSPVPQVGQTPFHFISESPALPNWKVAVKEMLEREYNLKFATFEDAIKHFQQHLDSLPSDQDREAYADRMRDRARKNFFRLEARNPSYDYTKDQKERLSSGAAPIEGQQLEHMEEVKTKVREGIKFPGHPERALDPSNIYLTQGGPRGTAPKGSKHAEKTRTIKAAKEKSQEIRKNPPKPSEIGQSTNEPTEAKLPSKAATSTASVPKADIEQKPAKVATPETHPQPQATPKGVDIPAKPGSATATASPDVPKKGSQTVGRVTVEYDYTSETKAAVKLKSINLSDYPPDKEGPVTRFFKNRPLTHNLIEQLSTVVPSLAVQYASNKALDRIQSHFESVLEEASKEFRKKFPDTDSLWDKSGIDQHRKAYNAAVAKLKAPNAKRDLALAWTALLTPEKDRDAALREVAQNLADVGGGTGDVRSYLDISSAYVNAMVELQEQLRQIIAQLSGFDDDIWRRASVLRGVGQELEQTFWKLIQSGGAMFPVIYYELLNFHFLGERFTALGDKVWAFADEINSQTSEYQRQWDSLDKELIKVSTQLDTFFPRR